jgi:hypothetical protein
MMRWFRTSRTFLGAIALFALALQIVLAFGHVHLPDFARVPGVTIALAQETGTDPTGNKNTGHSTDDYCLICASVTMVGTLVVSGVATLPAPIASSGAWYGRFCTALCDRVSHAPFRARAPPSV